MPPDDPKSQVPGAREDGREPGDAVPPGDGPPAEDGSEAETEGVLPFLLVGIGASAGGADAFIRLFKELPADTGMAYIAAPHMALDQKSHLPDILRRQTHMEVSEIRDGARPEPNRVYVLPPGVRVSMRRGAFRLEKTGANLASHPIDFFFQSLAADQKNRAIGVVLSGMDSDGTLGLRAIKGEGGIAIVQAPETARFPEMPRSSISGDNIDFILPPESIAVHLARLGEQFRNPGLRSLEEGEKGAEQYFTRIVTMLRGVSGIDFRQYKPTTLRRRITRRMMLHRIENLAAYDALLRTNAKELRELQEDCLINVTRFFRDPEAFDALKTVVLPQILEGRAPDHQIRIWSAGCSSGEEVYSIAICLLEQVTGNVSEPPIQIFGTDASDSNVQKARLGMYPESISADVSPERLRRYFSKTDKGYQVSKRVRDLCIFARQNLSNDPPFSRLDLISCRNVLIYFGAELQRHVVPTFHYALRQNGFLLLGASETIRGFAELFVLADRKHKIFSKIGTSTPRIYSDVATRSFAADLIPAVAAQPMRLWSDVELQRAADRVVCSRFGPPGVVVNEHLEVLQFRGDTTPFFVMPEGAATLQLTRIVREGVGPYLIEAVRRAIQSDSAVQVERVSVTYDDVRFDATIEVLPIVSTFTQPKCYLVVFVPARKDESRSLAPPAPNAAEEPQRIAARVQHELASARMYLESLLEERDARNQELISANEEIQSSNEELQSTNEELETTKEELQSSNEELQTVNDELQNRNLVLTQASNDLSNLLNSVNLPVLMLSSDLTIRHFTPPVQKLMNLRGTDIGRPFGELRMNLKIEDLVPILHDVLDTLNAREIEVQDREDRWHLLRVRPYRTSDNKIEGLVIVLVDIDQLRRSQGELRTARDFARLVIESVPLPLAVVDLEYRVVTSNGAFARLAGVPVANLERRLLTDLALSLWSLEEPLRTSLNALREGSGHYRTCDFEHRTPGPNSRVLSFHGSVLQPAGQTLLLITIEDITIHKEAERMLQEEGERLALQVNRGEMELTHTREELRALARSLFTSQENERRRVARDLHDDISQRLARLAMDLDEVRRDVEGKDGDLVVRIQKTQSDVASLSADVRGISHQLHPSILEDLGLGVALRALTEEFRDREHMIASFFEADVPEHISTDIATELYRITQEALRNVAKHAGKTHVKVTLRAEAGRLRLQVVDAGLGFNLDDRRSGLGLVSMAERARQLGATLTVESALGEGTRVVVDMPLAAETKAPWQSTT